MRIAAQFGFYSSYVTHSRHKPTQAGRPQIDGQSGGVFEQSSRSWTTARSTTEVDVRERLVTPEHKNTVSDIHSHTRNFYLG